MSQPAPLDEEEIKNFINENYSLKTDRSLFIKPTCEFISDIYGKFLDDVQPCWRQGPKGAKSEPNVRHYMLMGITSVIRKYDLSEPKFNLTDLLTPTRKRTTAFLNILIYVKISMEELKEQIQQKSTELSSRREQQGIIDKELQKARLYHEDTLVKQANAPSEDKLKRELLDKKNVFQAVELKSKEVESEAKSIKDSIKSQQERILRKRVEIDALKKEIDEPKRRKETIKEVLNLREKVAAAKSKYELQSSDIIIEKNKDAAALDRDRTIAKDAIAEEKVEIDSIKKEISDINAELIQIEARKHHAMEQCGVFCDKLRQRYDALLKKKAQSDARTQEYLCNYVKSTKKISSFLGLQDTDLSLNVTCLANLQLDPVPNLMNHSNHISSQLDTTNLALPRMDTTYVKKVGG